jgi:hypothetical protein
MFPLKPNGRASAAPPCGVGCMPSLDPSLRSSPMRLRGLGCSFVIEIAQSLKEPTFPKSDICHLSNLNWPPYRVSPLDPSENGCSHREPRPVARSMEAILPLAPPRRRFRPVSAQRKPFSAREKPTLCLIVASRTLH